MEFHSLTIVINDSLAIVDEYFLSFSNDDVDWIIDRLANEYDLFRKMFWEEIPMLWIDRIIFVLMREKNQTPDKEQKIYIRRRTNSS